MSEASRRAAEEINLECTGADDHDFVSSKTVCRKCERIRAEIDTAIAQALDEQLESPLVAGCIGVVAELVRKGYGTSRADVVQGVEQAIARAKQDQWTIDNARCSQKIVEMERGHAGEIARAVEDATDLAIARERLRERDRVARAVQQERNEGQVRLAKAVEGERQRISDEYHDALSNGLDGGAAFSAALRAPVRTQYYPCGCSATGDGVPAYCPQHGAPGEKA